MWLPLCAVAGTVLLFAPFARRGVDVHHDGLMAKTALDVLAGQTLFRDTFSQYGALTPLVQAVAMRVFGERLLVLKLLTVVTYALSAGLFVATWQRLVPSWLASVTVLAWWACAPFFAPLWILLPWPSVIALGTQALSMFAFCRAYESTRPWRWGLVCGVAAAATQWARTPVGAIHTVALVGGWLYVLARAHDRPPPIRGLVAFLAGVIAIHATALAWLVTSDALQPWYEQTVVGPRRWASARMLEHGTSLWELVPLGSSWFRADVTLRIGTVPSPSHGAVVVLALGCVALAVVIGRWRTWSVAALGIAVVATVLAYDHVLLTTAGTIAAVAPIGLLLGMLHSASRRGELPSTVLAVALGIPALASWSQYMPVSDPRHVFWGLTPMLGGFTWALDRAAGGRSGAVAVVLLCLLLPLLGGRTMDVVAKLRMQVRPVEGVPFLAGMQAYPDGAATLSHAYEVISGFARDRPATSMVVFGPDALLATFVPDRRNWNPYFVQWPGVPVPSDDELRRYLAVHRPLVLIEGQTGTSAKTIERENGYRVLDRGGFGVLLAPPTSGTAMDR